MTDPRTDGPAMWKTARQLIAAVVRERDRVWTWASLTVYGFWSIARPTPSMQVLPEPVQWSTYGVLIVAGVAGAWGTWRGQWETFVVAHVLAVTAVLTVGGVVALRSESPVAALLFGFATALAYNLQRSARDRRLIRAVARRHDIEEVDRAA